MLSIRLANAIHQALKRIGGATEREPPTEAVRGVLYGTMALYLARYLNMPPASLPGDGSDRLDELPVAEQEIRAALLDAFDRQKQVDTAAHLAARRPTGSFGRRVDRGARPGTLA